MRNSVFFFFIFTVLGISLSSFQNNPDEINSTPIKHVVNGAEHQLIFENLLAIPEENHSKFIQRMKTVFKEIKEIQYEKSDNLFILTFHTNLPESDRLHEILTKFSLKDYSITQS